jgi:Arc/MetJ family transcription regulator
VRTSVAVDGALLDEARRAAGLRTDEETIEEALRLLVRLREQEDILALAGRVRWQSGIERSRDGQDNG